jgi:hypothetical protein
VAVKESYRFNLLEIKRQGRKDDQSPPSNADVKKGREIFPLPHMASWRTANYIIKYGDNFELPNVEPWPKRWEAGD